MGWNPFKSVTKNVGNFFSDSLGFVGKGLNKSSVALGFVNPFLGIGASSVGGFLGSDEATKAQLKINDKNLALQREMNQQNQANWMTQFDYTKQQNELQQSNWEREFAYNTELNDRNQANWNAEFEYNKAINQRNFDYSVEQNELTRQREDNAIQRRVSDAESAGLSPLAVVGSGGASSSVVSAPSALSAPSSPNGLAAPGSFGGSPAPSAPEMRAPVLTAPDFQNDLRTQLALLDFASQAVLQDRKLSSDEKVARMQTSTQKFIAVSQLQNAKEIADASNNTQLRIATNQLLELNRSNTAKEYQAKLDYFQKTISQITDGHGRFEYGKYDVDTCREHNEGISTRWADFVKTLPADSLSKSKSDTTSVSGGLGVNKSGSSGSGSGSGNKGKWQSITNHLMKGFGVDANLGVTKGQSDADSVGQSSSVRALIKGFWLRNENVFWIPKEGGF
uniref:DNA pilot protein n=1 Tax=Dulem virus 253 TaxID=3145730 RepID=A0AAU8AXE8_9VIRU